jgi:hypothetical protein
MDRPGHDYKFGRPLPDSQTFSSSLLPKSGWSIESAHPKATRHQAPILRLGTLALDGVERQSETRHPGGDRPASFNEGADPLV